MDAQYLEVVPTNQFAVAFRGISSKTRATRKWHSLSYHDVLDCALLDSGNTPIPLASGLTREERNEAADTTPGISFECIDVIPAIVFLLYARLGPGNVDTRWRRRTRLAGR